MNKTLISTAFIAAIATLTSGCANNKNVVKSEPVSMTKLEQTAQSVQAAIDDLVVAEKAKEAKRKHIPSKVPDGLETKLNIKWNGPIGQLLEKVKPLTYGYTFSVYGKEPAIPVIVNIKSDNISVYDLIKNAGVQAGKRALLTVDNSDPLNKKIEIRYPS